MLSFELKHQLIKALKNNDMKALRSISRTIQLLSIDLEEEVANKNYNLLSEYIDNLLNELHRNKQNIATFLGVSINVITDMGSD